MRVFCPSFHTQPTWPWMIHWRRCPFIASPMRSRTPGLPIQQSNRLTPFSSQRRMIAVQVAWSWRSIHSVPNPITLTRSPVLPSSRYAIAGFSMNFASPHPVSTETAARAVPPIISRLVRLSISALPFCQTAIPFEGRRDFVRTVV